MYDFNKPYSDGGYYIPNRMMPGIERYYKKGIIPGDFLKAVICDNLFDCVAHADGENINNLPAYVKFFHNNLDSHCWGSKEKMKAWAAIGGHAGKYGD